MHISYPIIIPYTDGEEQAGFETCSGNPSTESKGLHAWQNRVKEQNDLGATRHLRCGNLQRKPEHMQKIYKAYQPQNI